MKKVLVIGGGGREHALIKKLYESHGVAELFCYPGNGGIQELAKCPELGVPVTDVAALREFAHAESIDLTIVGPEAPLVAGIADEFAAHNLVLLGPTKEASQLEGSKIFAKEFMKRQGIRTANFEVFESQGKAMDYVITRDCPLVIKADGLAGGKGVYVCKNKKEAMNALLELMSKQVHGSAGDRIVIEEMLVGQECSYFALVNAKGFDEFGTAVDYKRRFDNNLGPNTGGMGCYSPCAQAMANPSLIEQIKREIVLPTISGMRDEGRPYRGFLYFGLMLTKNGPMVLEYNIRLGDPEAQVILPRFNGNLYDLLHSSASGQDTPEWSWHPGVSVGVVMVSEKYPEKQTMRNTIHGPVGVGHKGEGVEVYHGATEIDGSHFYATGGRILTPVGTAENFSDAGAKVYDHISEISFAFMAFRRDIAGCVSG